MTYIQPRALMGGISRQPFRPGQWQGAKIGTRNTTYIQNNFFGAGYNTGYQGYGNYYNSCNTCNSGEPSKFMKWMMGIGLGTTLLGGILKLFGVGGSKESGAIEPEKKKAADDQNPVDDGTKKSEIKQDVKDQAPVQAQTKIEEQKPKVEEQKPKIDDNNNKITWTDGDIMECVDDSGKTANIQGKLNITGEGNPPTSFTITDTSSGSEHVYTYQLKETPKEGEKPVYTCVSMNGQATSTTNEYTLEQTSDGKPKLVQYSNQNNFGSGLAFGKLSSTKSTVKTTTTLQNQEQKLSYEAEQYFNEHPYTVKNIGGRKVYVSEDGKLTANSEKQLWDMIENNQKLEKQSKTTSASAQTKTPESVANEIKNSDKYKGCDVKISKNSDGSYQVKIKVPGGEESRRIADLSKFDINEFTSRS